MKKLILLGIVLLCFASVASAFVDSYGTSCTSESTDYIIFNDTGFSYSNEVAEIIFDSPIANSINFTVYFENIKYTTSHATTPGINFKDATGAVNFLFRGASFGTDGGGFLMLGNDTTDKTISVIPVTAGADHNFFYRINTTEDKYEVTDSNYTESNLGLADHTDELGKFEWVADSSGTLDSTGFYIWNCTDSDGAGLCGCPSAAPPPIIRSSLNLSSPLPALNSQFNTQLLNFNLTMNSTAQANCSLYINETWNQTNYEFSSGDNIGVDFNVTYGSSELGTYDYTIGCWNGINDTNATGFTFYIDNVNPVVDAEDINNSHQELTLTYSINVSDPFLYSFALDDSCGNSYSNSSVTSPFSFDNSYNVESCGVGNQTTNITVCDGQNSSLNCIEAIYYWDKTAVVNITAYDVISGIFIDSFTINDSSKSISTTDGNVSFWQYAIGNYSLTIDGTNLAVTSATVSFNASINTYQFNLYTTNSFNFTFRDERTELVINQNITVEFISDGASYNYTAENGTLYVDLITPETYTLRYYSSSPTDYGLIREYIYELTNRTHQELTLWMIDDSNSTEITITVYDETTLNLVENAIVYVQRYFIDDNVYRTVAMYSTDVAGKSYFDIEADNQYYKILIDYPWETRKYTSEKFYFSGTAYNVYISFLEEIAEDFFDEEGISVNIIYSNPTSKFTATWVDSEAVATRYCLYLKKYGQYSKEILNFSCSTAHSGSIDLTGFENDTINYAVFTATINGKEKIIASSWKELVSDKLNSGVFGVFMTAVLVGMFSFMVAFHPISLVLGAAALIFSKMIGILDLGWPYIFGVFFAAIILSLMLRLWKR